MSVDTTPPGRRWRRAPLLIENPYIRHALLAGFLLYLVVAVSSLSIDWARVTVGLERGWRFIAGFLKPDFVTRWPDILQGLQESLAMAFTATVVGGLIAVPVGFGAARNIAPLFIYLPSRALIAVSRAAQEIIVAILLVAMFGFGPFAGFLTLTFSSIGFLAKLLAEAVEDLSREQLEAVRATGASGMQVLDYGILPQIIPAFVGLVIYRLDINFRESAVIGIVGAGGIGATLNTAIDRYEYNSAAAVLLLIIGIVLACEYLSSFVRGRLK